MQLGSGFIAWLVARWGLTAVQSHEQPKDIDMAYQDLPVMNYPLPKEVGVS